MGEIENIFVLDNLPTFSSNRNRDDILKVSPVSGMDNLNNRGQMRFKVSASQYYINLSKAYFSIEYSYTKSVGNNR